MRIVLLLGLVLVGACGREVTAPTVAECLAFRADTLWDDTGKVLGVVIQCPRR